MAGMIGFRCTQVETISILGIAIIVVEFNLSNCTVSSVYNQKRAATSHINDIKII